MYQVVEVKRGTYGWAAFEVGEPVYIYRDAVAAADALIMYRRQAPKKRKWKDCRVEVREPDGLVVYTVSE